MMERKEGNRIQATLAGLFILTAYFVLASFMGLDRSTVLVLEVFSGISVIGIAVILYPLLRGEKLMDLCTGYYMIKWFEGLLMIAGGILFYIGTDTTLALRSQAYEVHTVLFIISAFLLYLLLLRKPLIPQWMSYWGIVAVILLAAGNYLPLITGELNPMVLGLCYSQIMLNEVVMAVYLILHGFQKEVGVAVL